MSSVSNLLGKKPRMDRVGGAQEGPPPGRSDTCEKEAKEKEDWVGSTSEQFYGSLKSS